MSAGATEQRGMGERARPLEVEPKSEAPHLSVVIPVYRSATILPRLHARLTRALEALGHPFEIVYVDDASPDDAWRTLVTLRGDDARVRLIQLERNAGQHRALLLGLTEARGDFVVTMDDDLQHPPEEIAALYRVLAGGDLDVVIGRYDEKKHGPVRRLGTSLTKTLARLSLGIPRDLELTSFRIMVRGVAHALAAVPRRNPVIGFMLFDVTRRVSNVSVRHDPRPGGGSSYSPRALVRHLLVLLVDYTDWPRRTGAARRRPSRHAAADAVVRRRIG